MAETYKFDERRKALTRTIIEEDKINLASKEAGNYKVKNEQTYSEEGIKLLVGELRNQKKQLEQAMGGVNSKLESTKHLEEDKELVELREKLKKLQKIDQRLQAQEQRNGLLDNLKIVNEQLNDVLKAVTPHMKFD